jgi:hypothetical protein
VRVFSQVDTAAAVAALELDGTKPGKFSRHVVFPGVVLADNEHAGALVRQLAPALPDDVRALVDFGVYTRNRNFRLLGSSKFAHRRPFVLSARPAAARAWVPLLQARGARGADPVSAAKRAFLAAMIVAVPEGATLLRLPDARAAAPARPAASRVSACVGRSAAAGARGGGVPDTLRPLLEYVCGTLRPGAGLRYCEFHEDTCFVILGLRDNRYCENIGRQHKGNQAPPPPLPPAGAPCRCVHEPPPLTFLSADSHYRVSPGRALVPG